MKTLTAFDIIDRAFNEIADKAANCGIDFNKVLPLLNDRDSIHEKAIELDKTYTGKVKAWFYIKEAKNGVEFPVITFNTLKHGGIKETFNGYAWYSENKFLFEPITSQKTPFIPYANITTKNDNLSLPAMAGKKATHSPIGDNAAIRKQIKFQECLDTFEQLPRVQCDADMPYLAAKGFSFADLPIDFDLRHGTEYKNHFVIFKTVQGSFQKIYDKPQNFLNGNNKMFVGAVGWHYSILGDFDSDATVYLAEGLATSLAVYCGLINKGDSNPCVLNCLDLNNLHKVKRELESKGINCRVVIDNDIKESGNAGFFSALLNECKDAVYPELDGVKCDFADIFQKKGVYEVSRQLTDNVLELKKGVEYYIDLIKYAPKEKLKNRIAKACFIAVKDIINYHQLRIVSNSLIQAANERGFILKGFIRKELCKCFRKKINAVKKINCITDFNGLDVVTIENSHYQNSKTIDALNDKLSDLIIDVKGCWLINTNMGTGKTLLLKAIADKLKNTFDSLTHDDIKKLFFASNGNAEEWQIISSNPTLFNNFVDKIKGDYINYSIMYVCHRISLCGDASTKLDFANYQDKSVINGLLYGDYPQRLVVCLNSLLKFNFATDILFIDEIRQTYEHALTGAFDKKTNRFDVYNCLADKVRNAKIVVGCDADLNDRTVQWIKSLRLNEPINLIQQESCNIDKTITVYDKPSTVLDLAKQAIFNNENVWICTDSKNQANKAHFYLENELIELINDFKNAGLSSDDILIATSENAGDERVKAFKNNPNEESKKYKVIIHSPIISSGVSITNNHFSAVYGLFYGILSPNELMQTIGRVRTVNKIHVAFKNRQRESFISEKDIITDGMVQGGEYTYGNLKLNEFDSNRIEFIAARHNAQNNVKNDFLVLAQLKGYDVEFNDLDLKTKCLNKEFKAKRIDTIATSKPIDASTALQYKDNKTSLTQDQTNSLKLYEVAQITGKDYSQIENSDIEFFVKNGENGKVVFNYELATNDYTVDEIEVLKTDHESNQASRNKLSTPFERRNLLTEIMAMIQGVDITQTSARAVCQFMSDRYGDFYRCGFGNHRVMGKDSIKQLNRFLKMIGYELVQCRASKVDRFYRLGSNEQVKTYAENRMKKRLN